MTVPGQTPPEAAGFDDDEAEGRVDDRDSHKGRGRKGKGGQNKDRPYSKMVDKIKLCNSVAYSAEFSPKPCKFEGRCNLCHDIRKYLKEGRRGDLTTLDGKCPTYEEYGRCPSGWKCLFVRSHSKEVEREDGRKELVLLTRDDAEVGSDDEDDARPEVVNTLSVDQKFGLARNRVDLSRSDEYVKWLDAMTARTNRKENATKEEISQIVEEQRATYIEPPFRASEKRKLYFGPETPVLAPLTTQGNLPFRRLCVSLGAQLTYSEMAMGMSLVQGAKTDWAMMKAHVSETVPPAYDAAAAGRPSRFVVRGYDNARDLRFGAQIAGNVPWKVLKATQALVTHLPHLRVIDLNCGCPIDGIVRSGSGSAMLEHPSRLERLVRGMNAVSDEVPVSVKMRIGLKDDHPTAARLIDRLAFGRDAADAAQQDLTDLQLLGPPGCAAVTLHGRSRQQRYTREADWGYIAQCAALVERHRAAADALADTVREPDPRDLPPGNGGNMYFIGNGDVYSHVDYFAHLSGDPQVHGGAHVDAVMIGRGALVKPWLFEEIAAGQYLDKSATERLAYIERFVRYGLAAWGSDEMGVGITRRFLLEWLSFARRYVPIGLLEVLPPRLNERPPAYRGRNELETLMASENYKDWIKIRYVLSTW